MTLKPDEKRAEWRRQRQDLINQRRREDRWENPEKYHAWKAIAWALKSGKLVRPDTCSACGSGSRIQAHHQDYSKPLEVEWLCHLCHRGQHGEQL